MSVWIEQIYRATLKSYTLNSPIEARFQEKQAPICFSMSSAPLLEALPFWVWKMADIRRKTLKNDQTLGKKTCHSAQYTYKLVPWSCLHHSKWRILKVSSLFYMTWKLHAKCDQYKYAQILRLSMRASIGEFRVSAQIIQTSAFTQTIAIWTPWNNRAGPP